MYTHIINNLKIVVLMYFEKHFNVNAVKYEIHNIMY